MADEAFLFLLDDRQPLSGAPLAAVGTLECTGTPAVHGWLQAHGVPATSERGRVVPGDAEGVVPEGAERLPVPLSEEEAPRVRRECAPRSVTDLEYELLRFRETAQDVRALVQRALTAGIPAPRVARLTGLDPREIGRFTG
ncbi:DUF6003 family protein [Streptomyces fructofermentans]|uniref:Uncharacterized protein n=1 Tax=Streptomyces fructofermentans TaxID=152141 RepID=A0A918U521_9ACTN|nr:DUF6003 family protein [Streptomyces fructofermentans]GGX91911.1 hypothetical protein GCM10010515_68800 [Streptomyces fructofermentans]